MPLSLLLASLAAAGSAVGLFVPLASFRLLASLAAASALAACLAHRTTVRGAAMVLLGLTAASAAAAWTTHVAGQAERPPLVEWFQARQRPTPDHAARIADTPVRVRGRLLRDAAATSFGAQFPLAVTHIEQDGRVIPTTGGLTVSVAGARLEGLPAWRGGRIVEVPVGLRAPARYLNAGLADQPRALAWRGTPLVGSVKSGTLVEVAAPGAWWDERAADVRAAVRRAMARRVAPHGQVSAAVATAILIGERAQLAEEVERQLQEAGTYHVVAISGGNIALLAGAMLAVLWTVGIRFEPAAALTALMLVAHAWVIGSGASVTRATAMAAIYLALRVVDQRTAPVHALGVAAAGLLAFNPLEIAGAGFWLTFGATGALLMAAARWSRPTRWWEPLVGIVTASLAVELLLMPVSAYVFERVTLAGLVLNLAAVPAMGVVQAAASVCVLADVLNAPWIAEASGLTTHAAAGVLLGSSSLVQSTPWATWRVPPPSMLLLAGYYATVAVWWVAGTPPVDGPLRRTTRRLSAGLAIALWGWIAFVPLGWLAPVSNGLLRVTALDVGQGDALLITTPDGMTVMVDAGGISAGTFDIGDRVVGPSLRARGLRRLDYLAVTHGDFDHLGGARSLLHDFIPREVWAGVPVAGHVPQEALRAAAKASRTPWRWLQRGDRLELGAAEVRVHHPPLPDWERQRVRNDDSLVLEVRYGAVSVWLTGDISRAVESELLSAVDSRRVNVLKAAHHGSLTSSGQAWLEQLRPAAVLVSAGRANLFGHPAPAVLDRYASLGAAIFRTDADGQIELVTNGHFIEVSTFTGRRWRLR